MTMRDLGHEATAYDSYLTINTNCLASSADPAWAKHTVNNTDADAIGLEIHRFRPNMTGYPAPLR